MQPAEDLGVSLDESLSCVGLVRRLMRLGRPQSTSAVGFRYRHLLAKAKLVGAMKFMQMGKVSIDSRIGDKGSGNGQTNKKVPENPNGHDQLIQIKFFFLCTVL